MKKLDLSIVPKSLGINESEVKQTDEHEAAPMNYVCFHVPNDLVLKNTILSKLLSYFK